MKKLLKQILIDIVLYAVIFLAIVNGSELAENILSFFIIAIGSIIAFATILGTSEAIKKFIENEGEGCANLASRYYGRASTLIEVSIFASQGWYWMAGLWFTAILMSIRISSIYDEIYGKPKLI